MGRVVEKGDANCDGIFDGLDIIFILEYVAARGNNFETELGAVMSDRVSECQKKYSLESDDASFLDTDDNKIVEPLDLLYMLEIKAGNFFFMAASASIEVVDTCFLELTLSCYLADGHGDAARKGTRLLFDVAFPAGGTMAKL